MNDLFLTDEELKEMSGYSIKSKHIEYLEGLGLPFFISRTGHPRVPRVHITGHPPIEKKKPNLQGLSRAKKKK